MGELLSLLNISFRDLFLRCPLPSSSLWFYSFLELRRVPSTPECFLSLPPSLPHLSSFSKSLSCGAVKFDRGRSNGLFLKRCVSSGSLSVFTSVSISVSVCVCVCVCLSVSVCLSVCLSPLPPPHHNPPPFPSLLLCLLLFLQGFLQGYLSSNSSF